MVADLHTITTHFSINSHSYDGYFVGNSAIPYSLNGCFDHITCGEIETAESIDTAEAYHRVYTTPAATEILNFIKSSGAPNNILTQSGAITRSAIERLKKSVHTLAGRYSGYRSYVTWKSVLINSTVLFPILFMVTALTNLFTNNAFNLKKFQLDGLIDGLHIAFGYWAFFWNSLAYINFEDVTFLALLALIYLIPVIIFRYIFIYPSVWPLSKSGMFIMLTATIIILPTFLMLLDNAAFNGLNNLRWNLPDIIGKQFFDMETYKLVMVIFPELILASLLLGLLCARRSRYIIFRNITRQIGCSALNKLLGYK